jgi:hypothetical protein
MTAGEEEKHLERGAVAPTAGAVSDGAKNNREPACGNVDW